MMAEQEQSVETVYCHRRFISPATRSAFLDAVAALSSTPDNRAMLYELESGT